MSRKNSPEGGKFALLKVQTDFRFREIVSFFSCAEGGSNWISQILCVLLSLSQKVGGGRTRRFQTKPVAPDPLVNLPDQRGAPPLLETPVCDAIPVQFLTEAIPLYLG